MIIFLTYENTFIICDQRINMQTIDENNQIETEMYNSQLSQKK